MHLFLKLMYQMNNLMILVDDAIQYFQERHFDGVERMYLKYKITQDDLDRGRADPPSGTVGITTQLNWWWI